MQELGIAASLSTPNRHTGKSPADVAREGWHFECLIALHNIGVCISDTITRIAQGDDGHAEQIAVTHLRFSRLPGCPFPSKSSSSG